MALSKIDDRGLNTPIDLLDNEQIRLGTGNDLQIYHDPSGNGTNRLRSDHVVIIEKKDSEDMASFTPDGAVALYFDGNKKYETTSYGSAHTGIMRFENSGDGISFYDSRELKIGSGDDLKIYHDGSHSIIKNSTGSLQVLDGSTEKFRVSGTGTQFNDDITLSNDNDKINIGAGSDLQLYHDGSNSVINNGTGELYQKTATNMHLRVAGDEKAIEMTANGTVKLFYDDAVTFQTSGIGNVLYKSQRVSGTGDTWADGDGGIKITGNTSASRGNISMYYDTSILEIGSGVTQKNRIELHAHSGDNAIKYFVGNAQRGSWGSAGLRFGTDTAAANSLDDYEEGTFDGKFITNSGTFPTQTVVGHYVKIGKRVDIHCQITFSGSAGSGGGLAWIELPFSVCNARGGMAIGLVSGIEWSADHQLFLVPELSSQACYLVETEPNAAGHAHLSPAAFKNSASQLFSYGGSYMAT